VLLVDELIIVGAGGHGRSVAEAILLSSATKFVIAGFVDDSWATNDQVWDFPILGGTSNLDQYLVQAKNAIVAIGNNKLREKLQSRLVNAGFNVVTIIHPQAIVSPSAKIGTGSTIMAGAIVGTESQLGEGVIVNSGAVVDHHCEIGNYGHLGVGTAMAGGSRLGKGAWLHAGNALGYGEAIADWAVVN
jgi:sugar O-acyltransferase (sialic acid O-acetyltransferase NeuD family)